MVHASELFNQLKADVIQQATNSITMLEGYRQFPKARVETLVAQAAEQIVSDFDSEDPQEFPRFWANIARERLNQGVPLSSVLQAIKIVDETIAELAANQFADALPERLRVMQQSHRIVRSATIAMYDVYEQSYNSLLAAQESVMREISTPIMPIHEGVLVLPLVGAIDSNRAGTIIESLLESITAHQADVVIMDITGVPVIDTGIANYLLQAARAVRLLGSQVVLVGISPDIAQTIVQLGIDLSGIVTRSNLQSGIEFALGLLDLAICAQTSVA